ncbi:MAG: hypothetical protein KDB27_24125 [Planctomycetales bacterium]|nr:hypothetical protein [Planctomycetales bacterium]
MTPLVQIAMYGWIPVSLIMFREWRGYRGVLFCFVAGTVFLPETIMQFGGIPDYSKFAAICYGVLLAAALLDPRALLSPRLSWYDLPIVVYCLIPIPSCLVNGLSFTDGVNYMITHALEWGLPYFIGRAFLSSFAAFRSTVFAVFLGGLACIPFCLFEARMSPILSRVVYGIRSPWNAERLGGYRPCIFFEDGLQLGLWMTAATLCGFAVFRFKTHRRLYGMRIGYLLSMLLVTTILCRSTGALVLLIASMSLVYLWQKTRWPLPIILLALFPIVYMGLRVTSTYNFSHVGAVAKQTVGADRAQSFEFRTDNEDILIERALQSPLLGWGGFGRNRVKDDLGKDIAITDGFWVILLGSHGLVGLVSFYLSLLAIPMLCVLRFSSRRYRSYDSGALIAVSVLVVIIALDGLLNAFTTIVYPLCLGGLATVLATRDAVLMKTYLESELLEEETPTVTTRKLWPQPFADVAGGYSGNHPRIPKATSFDTIEDESSLNETR